MTKAIRRTRNVATVWAVIEQKIVADVTFAPERKAVLQVDRRKGAGKECV